MVDDSSYFVEVVEQGKSKIEAVHASGHSERILTYRKENDLPPPGPVSVIVQQMVDASCAGVLFTVDPVTGRHDRLVIDAIEGLGEALVESLTLLCIKHYLKS